jgi:DUSAM domain-containing protein
MDQTKPEKDDWEQVSALVRQVDEGGELDPAVWRDFLMRVGPAVGVASDECEMALTTAQGAAGLVRKVRHCIDEGDARFAKALLHSRELSGQGKRDDARRVLQEFIAGETVVFFREMAEYCLGKLT